MRKKDLILLGGILLLAAALFLCLGMGRKKEGSIVKITIKGVVYGTYSLDEDREIKVKGSQGTNVVCIKDGKVFMKEADCPDQYCVDHNAISNKTDTIVCLPHRLVVEVSDDGQAQENIDVTVR